jgi:hypothetical protein
LSVFNASALGSSAKKMLVLKSFATNVFAEMKYLVAALYSNYSTSILDDTGIEQIDSYTAPPKNDKLMIRLDKLPG